jgi:hypothetical protein
VHAIAAKGPRVLSGAAATPNEFGAWISEGKREAAGTGGSSLPRPSPGNRRLVTRWLVFSDELWEFCALR